MCLYIYQEPFPKQEPICLLLVVPTWRYDARSLSLQSFQTKHWDPHILPFPITLAFALIVPPQFDRSADTSSSIYQPILLPVLQVIHHF